MMRKKKYIYIYDKIKESLLKTCAMSFIFTENRILSHEERFKIGCVMDDNG